MCPKHARTRTHTQPFAPLAVASKKVGSSVKNLACGDRVALEPGVPCRTCEHCKTGAYNLCEKMEFHATPVRNEALIDSCVAVFFFSFFFVPVG